MHQKGSKVKIKASCSKVMLRLGKHAIFGTEMISGKKILEFKKVLDVLQFWWINCSRSWQPEGGEDYSGMCGSASL